MPSVTRRALLGTVALGVGVATGGCYHEDPPGVNETLEIRNRGAEAVTLHITIEEGLEPEDREVVFDRNVTVEGDGTKTLDVLGESQYHIDVETDGEVYEFGTRPICDSAFTTIVVTESGDVRSEVRDCGA